MRIIAGKYRGKLLKEFKLSTTKPTTDKVKEAIFDMIQFDVMDSVVLDLFAGTGGLGIEAISRGANKVCFVDNNQNTIDIIKKNLTDITENYQIFKSDYMNFLINSNERFDIVLLDPPYATDFGVKAIDFMIKSGKLNNNAIIIFETSNDKNLNFDYPKYKFKRKKYGTVIVYKIEKID